MTSTKQAGGVLINYSNRFSILGLTGDTALMMKQAAMALDGNTAGPPAIGNDLPSIATSSVASTTSSSSTVSPTIVEAPTRTHFTSTEASEEASEESITNDNPSSGLSKGATAAIAVAVTIAIIAACAALAWHLYARRLKKQNEVHEIAPGTIFHHKPMSELSTDGLVSPEEMVPRKSFWTHTGELSFDSMVYEAGSGQRPPELDTVVVRYELEGSVPTTPIGEKADTHV